ncbi:hypothetical protein ACLKA6_005876 [Drosophila palustris]
MVRSGKAPSLKRELPEPEEASSKRKTLLADSSRQSVREIVDQWRKVAAEKRLSQGQQDGELSILPSMAVVRKHADSKSSVKRISAASKGSYSGTVTVTHYQQPPRTSMNATQIETDQGAALYFHQPVRGSSNLENAKRQTALKSVENKPT